MARLLAVVTALLAQVFDPTGPLRGPIEVGTRRAEVGRPLPDPVPAPIPRPIRDLIGVAYYTDASRSIADPVSKEMNQAAFASLRDFVRQVTDLAEGWMESRPARPAYAVRALDLLSVWARAGALLGTTNQQGEYEREWTLGSLALAYLKLRDAPGLDPAVRAEVEAWLVKIAAAVQPHYGHAGRMSSANNHACWAGLAVAVTGAATQSHALFDWGLAQGRIGIAQVRSDGFLPLELGRKTLALHYHIFALAPLVMLAELGEANGIHLYAEGDSAIQRLADRVIAGLGDPSPFATAAGVAQQLRQPPRGADLAWAEPYFARFHDRRLAPFLAVARPLRDDRLGGDLTAAFALPSSSLRPPWLK
jgi:poly(beta-D-mannuronate) lyase